MAAIGAAESGNYTNYRGDPISIFDAEFNARYAGFDCGGYYSFGPFQVFNGVWHNALTEAGAGATPCEHAAWLDSMPNAAATAAYIFNSTGGGSDFGFTAWSMYNNGGYLQYLPQAQALVSGAGLSNLRAERPVCSDAPYTVALNWEGRDFDLWIDISTDPDFGGYSNIYVSSGNRVMAPAGFSLGLVLQPNTSYYWRIWDGANWTYGPNFTVPSCGISGGGRGGNAPGTPSPNPSEPIEYPYENDPQVILESFDIRHRTAIARQNLAEGISRIEGASI